MTEPTKRTPAARSWVRRFWAWVTGKRAEQGVASDFWDLAHSGVCAGVRVTVQTPDGTWAMEGLMSDLDLRPRQDDDGHELPPWLHFGMLVAREKVMNTLPIGPHGEQEHFKVYRWWTDRGKS